MRPKNVTLTRLLARPRKDGDNEKGEEPKVYDLADKPARLSRRTSLVVASAHGDKRVIKYRMYRARTVAPWVRLPGQISGRLGPKISRA